jgi:hypothetical protein
LNSESNRIIFNIGVCAGREKLSPECFPLRFHIYTCRWQCRKKLFFSDRIFFWKTEKRSDVVREIENSILNQTILDSILGYAQVERNSLLNVSHYLFICTHIYDGVKKTFFFRDQFFPSE